MSGEVFPKEGTFPGCARGSKEALWLEQREPGRQRRGGQGGAGQSSRALWVIGRMQAFTLRKVGAMDGSRQRDVP